MSEVTIKSDHRDLRIFINSLLHVHVLKSEYVMFQSYKIGSQHQIFHIDIHTKSGILALEYDNELLWRSILILLDTNI